MNTLLIDIGNSRIKWALLRGRRLGRQHVLPLIGDGAAQFARMLGRGRGAQSRVAAVVAVNVAGHARERTLSAAVRRAGLPPPLLVISHRSTAGVRNGYRDAWRLGADRWVAAIGAWHLAGRRVPVCVIDVGTALTIDVVDAAGLHCGGLIAPGPELMVRSLLRGTRGIARRAAGAVRRGRGGFATDTRGAIESGAAQACAALIERAGLAARTQYGTRTRIYLTGGAAASLRSQLRLRHVYDPGLVLHGLAVIIAAAHVKLATVARRVR